MEHSLRVIKKGLMELKAYCEVELWTPCEVN
jgi:hypothetical protein